MRTTTILTSAAAASALTLGTMGAAYAVDKPAQQQETHAQVALAQLAQATALDAPDEPGVDVPDAPDEPGVDVPDIEQPTKPAPAPEVPTEPAPVAPAPAVPAPAPVVPPAPVAPVQAPVVAAPVSAPVSTGAVPNPAGPVAPGPVESSHSPATVAPVPQQGTAIASIAQAGPAASTPTLANPRHINSGAAGSAGTDPIVWILGTALAGGSALLMRAGLMKRPRHRAQSK